MDDARLPLNKILYSYIKKTDFGSCHRRCGRRRSIAVIALAFDSRQNLLFIIRLIAKIAVFSLIIADFVLGISQTQCKILSTKFYFTKYCACPSIPGLLDFLQVCADFRFSHQGIQNYPHCDNWRMFHRPCLNDLKQPNFFQILIFPKKRARSASPPPYLVRVCVG